jgi:integrase/recombinase XerD
MILYGTGMRRTEVSQLKVSDIDSQRMVIRVERSKGGHDRDLPLSAALLETINVVIQLRSGQLQGWWRFVPLAALMIWLAGLTLTFT